MSCKRWIIGLFVLAVLLCARGVLFAESRDSLVLNPGETLTIAEGQTLTIGDMNMFADRDPGNIHITGSGPMVNPVTIEGKILPLSSSAQLQGPRSFSVAPDSSTRNNSDSRQQLGAALETAISLQDVLSPGSALLSASTITVKGVALARVTNVSLAMNLEGSEEADQAVRDKEGNILLVKK